MEMQRVLLQTAPERVQGEPMTLETATAIVNVYNAARELQHLSAEGTKEDVFNKLMEIRHYAMEGLIGGIHNESR
jgi:hypothetical protein